MLDTHALVWAVLDRKKLGAKARAVIAATPPEEIGLSNASIMKLGRLIYDGDFKFEGHPSDVFGPALVQFTVLPVSLDAAIAAPALALPHGDPYDRLIVATALERRIPLISRDGNITDSGLVRIVW